MIPLILALTVSFSSYATSDIKCEASYDKLNITHQKVSSLQDFYYCFGYHHGRDRAWEMDYFRRVGQGRNSELYGFSSLKGDLMMRVLDLPKLAKKLYKGLPQEQKDFLKAYSRGSNLGFEEGKNAQEFKDLGFSPEPWEPHHSLLVLLLQSFDNTKKSFLTDYDEEKYKENWKEKTLDLFDDEKVPWLNTILKEGEYPKKKALHKTTYAPSSIKNMWADFPEVFGKESGSNNWVIKRSRSKSGFAMLANDPHLDLKTPLLWYWVNFTGSDFSVVGASVPGVPVVVSGTNGKVAWGLTNAYINTADVVFVKDMPKEDIISVRPTVKVKWSFLKIPFFFKAFEKTKNGDVILPLELENKDRIVLKWSGFHLKPEDITPMLSLIHTKDVSDMNELLKKVGLPAWNYVFVDSKGDIGFRVVGKSYKNLEKDSYGMDYERVDQLEKHDFLDPEDRPHLLKPTTRDYIYTANNRHWPADSQFYGGRGYSYSFRGFRIDEMLKNGIHDLTSFQKIQCDRQATDARFFVPKIMKVLDVAEFRQWNFESDPQSVAPSIYRRLMDLLMEGWQVNETALFHLLDNLDEKHKDELSSFYSVAKKQVAGRRWGKFHRLTFSHMSKNPEWKFSPEISGVGDNHSVDVGSSKWLVNRKVYEQFSGASMRMIIIMKPKPEIHLSLPGYNREYTQRQQGVPSWVEWRDCRYSQVDWQ